MGAVCCRASLEEVDAEPVQKPVEVATCEAPVVEESISSSSTEDVATIEERLKQAPKFQADALVKDVYKFGKTLGTGGFAVVKLVTHRKTREEFACKIMSLPAANADLDENENTRVDVYKEIEILCGMEHQNVICMKEFYEEDDRVYLIMELLTGGELLDAVLERGNYSEADACLCFKQLVEGIGYLHSKGVVHRDLKLENLMLASPDNISNIKIVDFGLSKLSGKRDTMGTVCGTPQVQHVPMERLETAYGKAVDMWSAGVVLFILLGGYPPFHHANESVMFEQIRRGSFRFEEDVWGTISRNAKDLIRKLLTTDPKSRLTAEQCLLHPWFSAQPSDSPLSTTTENLKKHYRRQFRKAVNVVLTINKMKRLTIVEDESVKLKPEAVH